MDNLWERSIPLYKVSNSELNGIFNEFDSNIKLSSYKEITIGCRNSNYIVTTDNGFYFLRVSPQNTNGFINEKAVFNVLYNKINIPKLHFVKEFDNRAFLIYEYINSRSLQSICTSSISLKKDIICQVAKSAAIIHNLNNYDIELIQTDYPPFSTWYDLFLSNYNAVNRLGNVIVERVRSLINDYESYLHKIDMHKSIIHSDFRPANMVIDVKNNVFIVDWEFAGVGHILADIGQFFRYRQCFDNDDLLIFENEYNSYAKVNLPQEWYKMSKLRDLVNPLQMIGEDNELPLKFEDLKNIIIDTLEFFEH